MEKTITDLKIQKGNHQRLNVYLDGEFAFGLSRFVAAWLNVGQEISEEKIFQLLSEDAQEIAYQKAVKYIGYRIRTKSEVEKHLTRKEIEEQVINQVVERLERNGLLNDTKFAEMWVDNRNEFRPRSHRLLALELRNKGITDEIIEDTLENSTPDDKLAYQAALKQARRFENLEWNEFYQKLGSYLARRGFSYSTIKPVVEQVWTEKTEEK